MVARDNAKSSFELLGPAGNGFSITADADFPTTSRAIYVGVGGNINAVLTSGDTVLFKGAQTGATLAIACKKILATSTTATDLVGLY